MGIGIAALLPLHIPNLGHGLGHVVADLSNGHPGVHFHRVQDGYLKRPVPTKTNIAEPGGLVYTDTQAAYAAFAFEDRDKAVCLGVFERRGQIQVAREQHKTLRLYLEVPDVTGLLSINNVPVRFVYAQVRGQVYIYGVGTNCARYHRLYDDVALVKGVE